MNKIRRTLGLIVVLLIAGCLRTTPQPARPTVVIRDVTLVDVEAGTLRPHTTVTITGSRISNVEPAEKAIVPTGATTVDGSGKFLIPGLWDMHSHSLWSEEAMQSFLPLYVSQGVTGIRDMGGKLSLLRAYRDSMTRTNPPWPRIIASGEVLDGAKPVQADISIAVPNPAAAVKAVDSLAKAGVNFIKVYTMLSRDSWYAVLAEAHKLGLPVAGHVPAEVTPDEASVVGQRSIEHLRDEIEPFCTPRDVESCKKLAAVFHANNTWQVPTLTVLHAKAFFDDTTLVTDPRLKFLPPSLQKEWLDDRRPKISRGKVYADGKKARYADESWLIGFLSREQVPLLAGTDAGVSWSYPGFSIHDELQLMVAAGLNPLEALRSATLSPAIYLAARDSMGTVAKGRVADMVLLTRNPLADISATRDIDAVFLRGRVLDRHQLDALLNARR